MSSRHSADCSSIGQVKSSTISYSSHVDDSRQQQSTINDAAASRLRRLTRQRLQLISWLNVNQEFSPLQTRVRATLKRINRAILIPELDVECRPIPGFPGYEATSDGRIIQFHWDHQWPARFVDPYHGSRPGGPLLVGLNCNGKRTSCRVQKFIAMAFHEKPQVDYRLVARNIDGNEFNNRADNLAWMPSRKEKAVSQRRTIRTEARPPTRRQRYNDLREQFPELTQLCLHTHGTSRLTELYRQQEQVAQWISENNDRHPLFSDAEFMLERVERLIAAREANSPEWPVFIPGPVYLPVVKPAHPIVDIARILRNREARAA